MFGAWVRRPWDAGGQPGASWRPARPAQPPRRTHPASARPAGHPAQDQAAAPGARRQDAAGAAPGAPACCPALPAALACLPHSHALPRSLHPAPPPPQPDPTLLCSAFQRQRLYLFTKREPAEAEEAAAGRCGAGRRLQGQRWTGLQAGRHTPRPAASLPRTTPAPPQGCVQRAASGRRCGGCGGWRRRCRGPRCT